MPLHELPQWCEFGLAATAELIINEIMWNAVNHTDNFHIKISFCTWKKPNGVAFSIWTKDRFYWSWEKLRKNIDSGYPNTEAQSRFEIDTCSYDYSYVPK